MYADNEPLDDPPQGVGLGSRLDVTDGAARPQKARSSTSRWPASKFYNNTEKKRSYDGVPFKSQVLTMDIGEPGRERPASRCSNSPKTGRVFQLVQADAGAAAQSDARAFMRWATGVSTTGDDPTNAVRRVPHRDGGYGIYYSYGKLDVDDPQGEGGRGIKALTAWTTRYKEGDVLPGAIQPGDGTTPSTPSSAS